MSTYVFVSLGNTLESSIAGWSDNCVFNILSASLFPLERAWQPTPVFLPGESHGQRSLAGYSPWSRKEPNTIEATLHTHTDYSKAAVSLVFPCYAKSLQSCLTLCDPVDGSPPVSPVPGILQARTLEWSAISFSNARKLKVKVKSLSCIRLVATPWTAAYQAPPSGGFSRQEYWSGVPLPSPALYLESTILDCNWKIY